MSYCVILNCSIFGWSVCLSVNLFLSLKLVLEFHCSDVTYCKGERRSSDGAIRPTYSVGLD